MLHMNLCIYKCILAWGIDVSTVSSSLIFYLLLTELILVNWEILILLYKIVVD